MAKEISVKIARPFLPLVTEHVRYKLYHGGRGGGKSFAFADALLMLGLQKTLFIACFREIQNSIADSVHKLLSDRINHYGLEEYVVKQDEIVNRLNGTRFIFKGLRDQDSQKIKSLEGVDIAWIEEAQTVTKKSWDILSPTIRKDGSEIWISMNRKEESDPLWKALGANPDERTLVVKVNYYDNPFCPEELKIQALKCKEEDYDSYLHIWEGEPLNQGDYKLIPIDRLREAVIPKMDGSTSPLVIGLDIARAGSDKTVFCFRKGRWCYRLHVVRGYDTVAVADLATSFIKEYRPAKIFLDLGNTGAGVYDILVSRGYNEVVKGINFGGKAIQAERYKNKRAEMYDSANKWLRQELPVQIPDDDELFEELAGIERVKVAYDQLQLEDKDEFRKRVGRSPDKADAFVLTFAEPVFDVGKPKIYGNGYVTLNDLFADKGEDSKW